MDEWEAGNNDTLPAATAEKQILIWTDVIEKKSLPGPANVSRNYGI